MLATMYLYTGDKRYLAPVPRCIAWFERVNREIAAEKYPPPRYWEPGTNRPLYVVRIPGLTPEGYGKYIWTTDPSKARCDDKPCKGDGRPVVDVARVRKEFDAISALDTPKARAETLAKMKARRAERPRSNESPASIIAALDARGAWVTNDNSVPRANATTEAEERETVRGISTEVYVRRMQALIATLRSK
jgi:hypothetical protein